MSRLRSKSLWPEEGWGGRASYVEFSTVQLQTIARRILGRDDVVDSEVLAEGHCNTNVKLRFSDGFRAVLRVYQNKNSACRRDKAVLEFVNSTVPVPQFLGAVHETRKEFGGELADKLDGRAAALLQWVEGVSPIEAFQRGEVSARSAARALGHTLARIGRVRRFESPGLFDEKLSYRRRFSSNRESFVDFIGWSLTEGRARVRLGKELSAQLRVYVRKKANLLEVTEGEYGLVHGDYKPSNILMRSESDGWEVFAVLDWEFARVGTPLFDMAILLRHSHLWPDGVVDSFTRGFCAGGGELPEQWREITRLLDLQNLCGFLNAPTEHPEAFKFARTRIGQTVGG